MGSRGERAVGVSYARGRGGTPSPSCALGDVAGCVVSSLNIHGERERAGCGIYIDIKGSREGVFLADAARGEVGGGVSGRQGERETERRRASTRGTMR